MLAKSLYIFYQIPGGIILKRGKGRAFAASSLVEEDNAIELRVKEGALIGQSPHTGSSMKEENGLPLSSQ